MHPSARTRDEAHLFLDLHGCDDCGATEVAWRSALAEVDGTVTRRYFGACGDCGRDREAYFALPERPVTPAPGAPVTFGGDEPSLLLDPGDWLLVADICAQSASSVGDASDGDELAERRESLTIALAAMDEVLKFVPAGETAVPDAAFFTERGRTVHRRDPGRFAVNRLRTVRDAYLSALDRLR
ncbi:hypothetical protein ACFQX7_11380 [Luedemannella flava]